MGPRLFEMGRLRLEQDSIEHTIVPKDSKTNASDYTHDKLATSREGRKEIDDNEPEDAVGQEELVPNGGYGWVCVVCMFWMNAHTWGINSVRLYFSGLHIAFSLVEAPSRRVIFLLS
jgi:hypothetical protein